MQKHIIWQVIWISSWFLRKYILDNHHICKLHNNICKFRHLFKYFNSWFSTTGTKIFSINVQHYSKLTSAIQIQINFDEFFIISGVSMWHMDYLKANKEEFEQGKSDISLKSQFLKLRHILDIFRIIQSLKVSFCIPKDLSSNPILAQMFSPSFSSSFREKIET